MENKPIENENRLEIQEKEDVEQHLAPKQQHYEWKPNSKFKPYKRWVQYSSYILIIILTIYSIISGYFHTNENQHHQVTDKKFQTGIDALFRLIQIAHHIPDTGLISSTADNWEQVIEKLLHTVHDAREGKWLYPLSIHETSPRAKESSGQKSEATNEGGTTRWPQTSVP